MNFHIDIVSLQGSIYSGEASEVILPSTEGEITVLSRHMPIVTTLTLGEVVVKTPTDTINLLIGKGVFSFSDGLGRLLVEDVRFSDEISEEKVLEAKKTAEELIEKGVKGEEKERAAYALRKSLFDLKIVRRKKKRLL
ncbi:ATP synthase F1 subunit epsilon [Candidatus Woesebacteria bacterium RIFCSPLOWO2_01_FULL_39_61]|uniref:ATP synthase epsilon chain n=1 Tax=Candidatus Woesebacteria bacterium RIFCSPHIGHO2_02_FULL_39_13 TaxID=1802505 RepID=A0A1F7Z2J3_9BACT|nr:MAG: ATP synthase F1 subunit epsilon [Candidatus Woesebacteria bacterium RIFCSPHIGHO2_01_FULL_39_95]OGM33700.1 MAG: ATP synthase F1 subunit epsilon [Candidatus Woesebacteria bacterium RIFCSPHIGHO2_02_FULL_39_13]OGM38936.1 MAG: ATP synthase F1 subunit epsilon [Candidatus Woesebacteria bacterium RIFCSPHIGHO2_12_FULL_40_20]OGM68148.1 MAG: ATP synthase F1 subunit epsilon [Candidatus Woesebacteria bacterium RIFCSPLOWO2_01_FULL_39_61]OGM73179.1 MAG: ATP synthase F1 subunit epsilon [Candidatus Woes